jgi:glycolate oxidase FAD binding subunit
VSATSPEAVDGIVPASVVRPGSVAEVQAVVRAGRPLVVSGLGAHLDVGATPARIDALVRMDRLERIVDHEAADMTVTAEAGCALATLERVLGAAGQWLPLDPPSPGRTTVGGLIAANLSGPLRASQGTVRDLLIGIRVVDAEGRLVASGGKVVKNVAGYDLPKLHIGALGTVGVVVEATFKVRPRPELEEAALMCAGTFAAAADLALAVRDVLDPLWLEAGTIERGPGVAVGVGGIAAEVAAARRTIEAVSARRGVAVEWTRDGAALRRSLGAFPVTPALAVVRASVLPTAVGATMAELHRIAGDVAVLSHVANGVVRARLDDAEALRRILAELRPAIETAGGFLVVERARPDAKRHVDVWGRLGPDLALMRRVKAAYDPGGIFAPGRFVGGL